MKITCLFKSIRNEKGVSLPELMITMVLMSIVSTALLSITLTGTNLMQDIEARATSDREAQVVAKNLEWEIRSAQGLSEDTAVLDTAGGLAIQFYGVKTLGAKPTRFRYYLYEDKLMKGTMVATSDTPPWTFTGIETITQAGQYIRNNQYTPIFRYYNESGTEIFPVTAADRLNIRRIRISIVCDENTAKLPPAYTVTMEIGLRNQR